MRKTGNLLLLLVLSLWMTSCGSAKVIASWSLNPSPEGAMNKVLVLGVMTNREIKEQIEHVLVRELNEEGIDASSATDVFGPKGFRGLTEGHITDKLHGSAYTSILMVSLQNKENRSNYEARYSTPYVLGYSRYYRRYLLIYDNIYTPEYYDTSTSYILEADIYTLKGDELIYSAQTRSYDPDSAKSLAESFSRSIISELKEKEIVKHNH